MNKKFLTKVITLVIVVVLAFALAGCHVTYTTTNTETTTDANGNTTSTTTTTVNDNGNITTTTTTTDGTEEVEETEHKLPFTFKNESPFDVKELYLSRNDDEYWGEEMLGEYAPVKAGDSITFNIIFDETPQAVDIKIVLDVNDGIPVEWTDFDFEDSNDYDNFTITFTYDEETDVGSASITFSKTAVS